MLSTLPYQRSHILAFLQDFSSFILLVSLTRSTFTHSYQTICVNTCSRLSYFGKEVIQPQVPLRLPCYDFTPVMNHTVVNAPLSVKLSTSGTTHSHGVTGGVYKARERIHRNILICDY